MPRRPKRLRRKPPPLTVEQVLAMADHHFKIKKHWPSRSSGHVLSELNEKWANIDHALRLGFRTLPKGLSIARLLALHRGTRNRKAPPTLTEKMVLRWADEYRDRT